MTRYRLFPVVVFLASLLPDSVGGQLVIDWPIRTTPQPEAVLTGADAVFWNPGSIADELESSRQIWITHVEGPDATGVRGVAAAAITDLPMGLRAGVGYWHLGIQDIPRTTDSPERDGGDLHVAEDVAVLAAAGSFRRVGLGAAVRFLQGSVGREVRDRVEGAVGLHVRSDLPARPRLGLTLQGFGRDLRALGGVELAPPALASSRIPLHVGYGILAGSERGHAEHRLSIRGSWMGQIRVGAGLSYLGETDGWVRLWMAGADIGRYSLSVLREGLANGFGSVHYYRAAVRFD